MNLLLHICCAPCSTEVIERLKETHKLTGFFYNPNIHPQDEHDSRRNEIKRYARIQNLSLIPINYGTEEWFKTIKGLEKEPEGGKRCLACYRERLEKTAKTALEKGFMVFATTLSISPHKNSQIINDIGKSVGEKYGITFLENDFKKNDGFKKSIEHSKKYGLKRQKYCGCIYSQK